MTVPPEDPKGIPPVEPKKSRLEIPIGSGNSRAGSATLVALDRLTMVLHLQRRARTAEPDALPFIMVNETRQAFPYRQAAFVNLRRDWPVVEAISGLAVPDASSPYSQWLLKFTRLLQNNREKTPVEKIDLQAIADAGETSVWYKDWAEWLPRHGLSARLSGGGGGTDGMLFLFRDEPFTDAEAALFVHLSESYAQSYSLVHTRGRARKFSVSTIAAVLLGLALAVCFIPVRQSVLAPAEVSARRPAPVRSGLEGVVERLLIEPNQRVRAGAPLVRLDDTQLRTRLAVAKKAEEMADAEYKQLLQSALSDPRTKQRIPLAIGRKEQLREETAYIESQMERVVITSPIDGIALCDNPDEWLGRPVSLGQRILLVANADDVELWVYLPAAEAMEMAEDGKIVFYSNVTPDSPVLATVYFSSYRASEIPGVGMAYTIRANFLGDDKPLLGLRGTAKMYGPRQFLGLSLLQKPIAAVRQWVGI